MNAPSDTVLSTVSERVCGPYRGYYVGAYALPATGGYVGYAKVSIRPIGDLWDCGALLKVSCDVSSSPDLAVNAAVLKAHLTICELASVELHH